MINRRTGVISAEAARSARGAGSFGSTYAGGRRAAGERKGNGRADSLGLDFGEVAGLLRQRQIDEILTNDASR